MKSRKASGLHQPDSYPMEIGWTDTLGSSDAFLIRPISTCSYWDCHAEALHGIPRSQLLDEGISVVDAACRLNDMLCVDKVYCDALAFDGFWLGRLFKAADIEASFQLVDVFQLYSVLGIERAERMMGILRNRPVLHRAREDAERYASAYCEMFVGQTQLIKKLGLHHL